MSQQVFELLILGSSSASPTSERNPSAQLLNLAERYFLIDCGEATQIQLRKFKAKIQSIDHILISHLHGDHFFGLPGLLSSMHLLGRKQALTIYCPKELKPIWDLITQASDTRLNFEIKWHFNCNDGLKLLFEDDKIEVYSFPLKHRIFCNGFLFKEKPQLRNIDKWQLEKLNISFAEIHKLKKGLDAIDNDGNIIENKKVTIDPPEPRTYAYCSDTIYNVKVVDYLKNVTVLYHESTFLDDKLDRAKKTFHTTAKQAATIAKLSGSKKLLLGHFSARYGSLQDFLTEAQPIFENCELATDGKKIKI